MVTRTISQADEIVATIKELVSDPADADKVRTKHSENKLHPLQMGGADVLVITHAAYTRALEGLCREQYGRWDNYVTWGHGPRQLTIIDEALSGVVEENQIKADDIRIALSFVDPALRLRFPSQVQALEEVCDVLDKNAVVDGSRADDANSTAARIVWRGATMGAFSFPQLALWDLCAKPWRTSATTSKLCARPVPMTACALPLTWTAL